MILEKLARSRLLQTRWRQLIIFLTVMGPGIITSNVDNDAGGITTYSLAGAHFGYTFIWALIPIAVALILVQEMSARMGVVTGKGLADLIRERFGVKITFYLLLALFFTNLGNTISEFAGIAASLEIVQVSRYLSVPFGAAIVWLLVVKFNYKAVEKIFLVASTFYIAYIITGFMIKPEWGAVKGGFLNPQVKLNAQHLAMLVALVGTTIAPWMQFYLQSAIVEKNIKIENYNHSRLDVIIGSFTVNIVAFFIILVCAATLYKNGIRIESASDAAIALEPLAQKYASYLFAFGLLNASLFAASILPLSTAYVICEGLGWENGVNKTFAQAPGFYGLYTLMIVLGAIVVLFPKLPLVPVMYVSQVINGILLPVILIFILFIITDRKVMGQYVNSRFYNVATLALIVLMIFCSLMLAVTSL
jgi:NRAMP (natural resistance-associated macrophage protein)-like metal ion transporter